MPRSRTALALVLTGAANVYRYGNIAIRQCPNFFFTFFTLLLGRHDISSSAERL